MAKVLVALPGYRGIDGSGVKLLEEAGLELVLQSCPPSTPEATLAGYLDGCTSSMAAIERYTPGVMDAVPGLIHIARIGVGYDAVDIDAATERGILVTNTPGGNDWAVADHTLGLMLNLAHGIQRADRNMRSQTWLRGGTGYDVWRRTIGIVGLGRIGKGVARRARGFEMRILASEPLPDMEFVREFGVELVSFDELLRASDFVTLHLPLSRETAGFMDARAFALMQPGAFFINTARGGLVDEDALFDALATDRIAGAGIDVRQQEPNVDWRFNQFDNLIQTPHAAPATPSASLACTRLAAESILTALRGEEPFGLLNPEALDRGRFAAHQRSMV